MSNFVNKRVIIVSDDDLESGANFPLNTSMDDVVSGILSSIMHEQEYKPRYVTPYNKHEIDYSTPITNTSVNNNYNNNPVTNTSAIDDDNGMIFMYPNQLKIDKSKLDKIKASYLKQSDVNDKIQNVKYNKLDKNIIDEIKKLVKDTLNEIMNKNMGDLGTTNNNIDDENKDLVEIPINNETDESDETDESNNDSIETDLTGGTGTGLTDGTGTGGNGGTGTGGTGLTGTGTGGTGTGGTGGTGTGLTGNENDQNVVPTVTSNENVNRIVQSFEQNNIVPKKITKLTSKSENLKNTEQFKNNNKTIDKTVEGFFKKSESCGCNSITLLLIILIILGVTFYVLHNNIIQI